MVKSNRRDDDDVREDVTFGHEGDEGRGDGHALENADIHLVFGSPNNGFRHFTDPGRPQPLGGFF